MSRKTVLVPIYKDTPVNALEPFFESARSDDLHLNLVVVGIAPPTPVYAYGYPPYGAIAFPEEWQKTLEEINSDTGGKVEEIEKALMDEGVAAEVSKLFCEKSMIDGLIARHALVSDIAVMLEHLRIDMEVYDKILSGILYESPIAVVINPVSLEKLLHPSSVFIAWDGSARAAKAVQQALPLIGENTKVTVGWFDPVMTEHLGGEDAGADISAKLSRHGCQVTLQQYPSGGKEIADGIKLRASELGADLIVMGAYGHAKLRERIFGGTTQSMLDQTKQTVLFAH